MAGKNERYGSDDRLVKSAEGAVRGSRDLADVDRVEQDGTALSIRERVRATMNEMGQEILPTPPALPGWHFCWLSTTNSVDPIHVRMKLGYEPVKASELPTLSQYKVTQGEFDGCIACNEMILFKIPEEAYQELMLISHHERPLEAETEIRAAIDKASDRDSSGNELGSLEGFQHFGRRVQAPKAF